jgi:hypothetical protein
VDKGQAKQIGQRLAIKSGLIGIAIAYLIYAGVLTLLGDSFFSALLWISRVDYAANTIIGAVGLLAMAYLFGQLAGTEILIKKWNDTFVGIKYGLLTLWTATIIGSTLGFLQEGLDNIGSPDEPFFDYYFKPLYWVTMFGLIPAIVVGVWFGGQIRKRGLKMRAGQDASR